MSFLRSAALRASSATRAARSARSIRCAELQPWRAVQRRTYASTPGAGGSHSEAKSSDVPWMAAAVAGTIGGLYFVVNQDLGHSPGHDEDHHAEAHETHGKNEEGEDDTPEEEEPQRKEGARSSSREESKGVSEEESKAAQNAGSTTEGKGKKEIGEKGDPSQPGSGRPDNKKSPDTSQDEPKSQEPGERRPDKSDKPDPRGKPKSYNETSGKQEGLSNSDTHHSSQIAKQPEKSKKGEGVAESAKLKGTVSTERPGAENEEERGKAQIDKNA